MPLRREFEDPQINQPARYPNLVLRKPVLAGRMRPVGAIGAQYGAQYGTRPDESPRKAPEPGLAGVAPPGLAMPVPRGIPGRYFYNRDDPEAEDIFPTGERRVSMAALILAWLRSRLG